MLYNVNELQIVNQSENLQKALAKKDTKQKNSGTQSRNTPPSIKAGHKEFHEQDHPRAKDGRFGEKAGDHTKAPTKKKVAPKASEAEKGAKTDDIKKKTGAGKEPATGGTRKRVTGATGGTSGGSPKTTKPSSVPKGAKAQVKTTAKPKGEVKDAGTPAKPRGKQLDAVPKASEGAKAKAKPVGSTKAGKADSGKGSAKAPAAKPSAKQIKDIRSEAQANRVLAYDVGDKVGGARKDTYIKSFTADPTTQNLEALEKVAPEVAQKMCVKKNILPPVDFEREHKNGVEINAAMLKQLIFDRIAPKPSGERAEDRMAYLQGINKLHRIIAPIKTWDELRKTVSELGTIARNGEGLEESKMKIASAGKFGNSYTNVEYYQNRIDKATEAKKMLDFEALGEKLNNFFTKGDSRVRTFQTIHDKKLNWDNYFKPSEGGSDEKERSATRGATKKKWERMAVSEHQRAGGRATPIKKPEDMVKHFGMKGIEFGNWVDDASGLYHLKRSAEAFHDLADIVGVDDKDISLNGRLSMAFGARGKAGAVAHYEPDRKVINMTKHGGAGSLAHEWGHAMDNIMYQYSHGGVASLGLASDAHKQMGDHDPELKRLYGNLMDNVRKPTPGQPGGVRKVSYDTQANQFGNYYPEMRRDIQGGMSMQDTITKWTQKHQNEFDASMRAIDSMRGRYTEKLLDKRVQTAQRELKNKLRDLPHRVAQEYKIRNGRTSEHIKGEIEIPTGQSEYYTRMQEFDGGGKSYYAQGCEMFARVFESLIEDKLTAKKRKNNYLVWDTKTSKGNKDAPFPIGEERKHMHGAMDELLKYISKGKALKKALESDLQKGTLNGIFDQLFDTLMPKDYADRLQKLKERRDPDDIEKGWQEGDHPRDDDGEFAKKEAAISEHNELLKKHASKFGSAEEFAESVNRPGFGGKSVADLFGMIDANSHNHLDADAIKTYLSQGGDYYYLTHVDPKTLDVENEDHLKGIHSTPFNQANAKPIVVGNSNFIVDGRHRTVNAKQSGAARIQAYVPAQHFYNLHVGTNPLRKSIIHDPTDPYKPDGITMYRGIGQNEMDFINNRGYIQTKGKGNDADQGKTVTCFTPLFTQAEGYARSQYTLYGEKAAYVLALPKPPWVTENELGELESAHPVPFQLGVIYQIDDPRASEV
jgi:hypothetical protein